MFAHGKGDKMLKKILLFITIFFSLTNESARGYSKSFISNCSSEVIDKIEGKPFPTAGVKYAKAPICRDDLAYFETSIRILFQNVKGDWKLRGATSTLNEMFWSERLLAAGVDPVAVEDFAGPGAVDFEPSPWFPATCVLSKVAAQVVAHHRSIVSFSNLGTYKNGLLVLQLLGPWGLRTVGISQTGTEFLIPVDQFEKYQTKKSKPVSFKKKGRGWVCVPPGSPAVD
jgi:hypothetical protein